MVAPKLQTGSHLASRPLRADCMLPASSVFGTNTVVLFRLPSLIRYILFVLWEESIAFTVVNQVPGLLRSAACERMSRVSYRLLLSIAILIAVMGSVPNTVSATLQQDSDKYPEQNYSLCESHITDANSRERMKGRTSGRDEFWLRLDGVSWRSSSDPLIADQTTDGDILIVCAEIYPFGVGKDKLFDLSKFYLSTANSSAEIQSSFVCDETWLSSEDKLDCSSASVVDYSDRTVGYFAFAFEVPTGTEAASLVSKGFSDEIALSLPTEQMAGQRDTGLAATGTLPVASITEFGQEALVHVGMPKWLVAVDPNVEVRYYIGDQSVTPRRGQFLVIWFHQSTSNGEPLPMGNFELIASPGIGQPTSTYSISTEGTVALAATEWDWHPDFMDGGIMYRTGLVFDIKPEDTHFILNLDIPNHMPFGGPQIRIEFDA